MNTEVSKENAPIVPNIVTEFAADDNSSKEQKARNRMVAEGYKYKTLGNKESDHQLDAIDGFQSIQRKKRERRFIYLLAFAIVAATCLVVVIIFQHVRRSNENCEQGHNGDKPGAYILNKMDSSVDPCANFYDFSCGNWLKTTELPPSKKKYGAFAKLHDDILDIMKKIMDEDETLYKGQNSTAIHKARTYYKLCMDTERIDDTGITPMLKHISDLGSWPLTSDPTSGTFDSPSWNIQNTIVTAHKTGFSPLFNLAVTTDAKNSSTYTIGIEQSGLTLSDPRQYFPNHTSYEKLRNASIDFGVNFVTLLGGTGDLRGEITELYEFEQKLAQIHIPRKDLLDPEKTYHRMTIHEFQTQYLGSWLDMKTYMNDLFQERSSEFEDSDELVVYTPTYFTNLDKIIANTNKELLATYIVWQSVQSLAGYMPNSFIDVALKFDTVQSGITEYSPRWQRCLSKVDGILGFATGALYVQEHFLGASKKEIEYMFEKVRQAFITNLPNVPWMDEATRTYAIEKATAVEKMIGYPDYIIAPTELDEHYENLTLVEGDYFASHIASKIYYVKKNLRRLGSIPDKTEWSMTPTTVNGYYSADFNHIAFPAGILQPPMFNTASPRSFNFGSFGMIMGHELTHGFDDRGREFDILGNMRNWWSNSSSEGFTKHSQCIVDQYSNFTIDDTHLDGKTTLSENIADNGGLKMGYLAYKSSQGDTAGDPNSLPEFPYSADQLFFIGFAQLWCTKYTPEYAKQAILTDEHSIAQFRVLGTMSNSEYFAEAFNCSLGSAMNPAKKCVVW